jgi:hypothetical protein
MKLHESGSAFFAMLEPLVFDAGYALSHQPILIAAVVVAVDGARVSWKQFNPTFFSPN